VEHIFGSLVNKKIAALGLAYKPDVDDLRESPAIEIVHLLEHAGAQVAAFEPFKLTGVSGISMSPTFASAVQASDAILLLVGHTQFRALKPEQILNLTSARIIIDTVNIIGPEWEMAGFAVYQLGNGHQWEKSALLA